ncbi:hypothetical protein WBS45_28835 [Bacillus albus]|uniref:hypothetical protein n=1 Tax=Bacillus albus TaxID=2026189 RepID=UPI003014B83A
MDEELLGENPVIDEKPVHESLVNTDAGNIVVSHTLTLGDIVVSTLLVCVLFVMIYNQITRRF